MARFLNRRTLEYRRRGHTPDFSPADWIINPDLSAVAGVPRKYWTIDGDRVLEMSAEQKAHVDAIELEVYKARKLEILAETVLERAIQDDTDYQTAEAAVEAARTLEEVDAVELPS